jgi:hypothetical protein
VSTLRHVARRLPGIRGAARTLDRTRAERDRLRRQRDELAEALRRERNRLVELERQRDALDRRRDATQRSIAVTTFEKRQRRLISTARKQSTIYGDAVAGELWSRGFLPDKSRLYAIDRYGPDAYVTDLQREMAGLINEPYVAILSNKAVFNELFDGVVPTVPILGYTNGLGFSGVLPENGSLFAKPVNSGGGTGVFRATVENGRFIIDDRLLSSTEFINDLLSRRHNYIVSREVESHPEMRQFFDRTTNTLRVMMMRCPATREGFIAGAVLRVGTVASGDMDNFTRGGISLSVDLGTGRVGSGWQLRQLLDADGERDRVGGLTSHPDTGARLSGRRVPLWDEVIGSCRTAFEHRPRLQYVGWDIIVTPSGPVFLEGNHYPEPRVLQVHKPLLSDDRIRTFYDHHGILDWQPTETL